MTLTFRCGHRLVTDAASKPVCPTCGESAVRDVRDAAPVIRGRVFGPHVIYTPLDAMPVHLYEIDET